MKKILLLSLLLITGFWAKSQSVSSKTDIKILLAGDYADPSILKDGKDYYMTNTSTNAFPWLRLWHSTDMFHWKPIGYALNTFVGEVWAPDLVKYGDTYYIYFRYTELTQTLTFAVCFLLHNDLKTEIFKWLYRSTGTTGVTHPEFYTCGFYI